MGANAMDLSGMNLTTSRSNPSPFFVPTTASSGSQRLATTAPTGPQSLEDDQLFPPTDSERPRLTHAPANFDSFSRPLPTLGAPMHQQPTTRRLEQQRGIHSRANDRRRADQGRESQTSSSVESEDSPEPSDFRRGSPTGDNHGQSPTQISRDLYPAYDEYGHRRGMEHLHGRPVEAGGAYYQERTYEYPSTRTQGSPRNVYGDNSRQLPFDTSDAQSLPVERDQGPFSGFEVTVSSTNAPQPLNSSEGQTVKRSRKGTQFVYMEGPGQGLDQNRPSLRPPADTQIAENDLAVKMHLEPGTPINLQSLRSPPPNEKPDYSLPTLIKLAIWGSERKMLTLQEIYDAIETRFDWYKTCDNPQAWRNSIRHTLSLVAIFQKRPRPITEPGKGQYWYLDFTQGDGNKRIRKRNKKPTKAEMAKQASGSPTSADMDVDELEMSDTGGNTDSGPQRQEVVAPSTLRGRTSGRRATSIANRSRVAPYLTPEPPENSMVASQPNAQLQASQRIQDRHSDMPIDPVLLGSNPDQASAVKERGGSGASKAHSQATAGASTPSEANSGFGKPAFSSTGFSTYARTMPSGSTSGFAAFAKSSSSSSSRSITAFDRKAPIRTPVPKPGVEVVTSGGLPSARRVSGTPGQRRG